MKNIFLSLPLVLLGAAAAAADGVQCDLNAANGICLFGGQKVLVPDASPQGLAGYWSFDDGHCLDSSRHQNHGSSNFQPGPGRGGRGASAHFDGKTSLDIPFPDDFLPELPEYSVSFWGYFMGSSSAADKACPFLTRGKANNDNAFELSYNFKTGTLSAHSGVAPDTARAPDAATSEARLAFQRWHHIAVVQSKRELALYVNGILDKSVPIESPVTNKGGPVRVGQLPWSGNDCVNTLLVDELRLFSRPLASYEVEAESFGALGGVEPGHVRLACKSCAYPEAEKACDSLSGDFHVCYENELYAGALQVSRLMGWTSGKAEFHANAEKGAEAGQAAAEKAALCCSDFF